MPKIKERKHSKSGPPAVKRSRPTTKRQEWKWEYVDKNQAATLHNVPLIKNQVVLNLHGRRMSYSSVYLHIQPKILNLLTVLFLVLLNVIGQMYTLNIYRQSWKNHF